MFFSDDFLSARAGVKNRVDDSCYETEKELGRGRRKKTLPEKLRAAEDVSEDDPGTPIIPPPVISGNGIPQQVEVPKPKSPIKVISERTSRPGVSEKNQSVVSKVRGVRKSSSKVSSTDELRKKLEAAKERQVSKVQPVSASTLIDKIKRKDSTRSPLKSTSPAKWNVKSVGAPRNEKKNHSEASKRASEVQLSPSSPRKKRNSVPAGDLGLFEDMDLDTDDPIVDNEQEMSSHRTVNPEAARKKITFSPTKQPSDPAVSQSRCKS